jgi:predicted short-subunit dehydrogenase-like oxidoreductase (DUF2520 family)
MKIVIIGTGNAATILGRKLKAAGHNIVQVYGRNAKAASSLANELDAESTNHLTAINQTSDVYLVAVSDIAVSEVVKELKLHDKTIIHTAGSVSKATLNQSKHYGVFYPLQSLRKESNYLPDTAIIIDASDPETFQLLENIAHSISDKVVRAGDDERVKLHLAAVFTNNFVNHLYTLAEEYCVQEGLDFSLLVPLIKETALRVETMKPSQSQTGPAVRHDAVTIQKHETLLKNYPQLKTFYTLFTESIWNKKNNSDKF